MELSSRIQCGPKDRINDDDKEFDFISGLPRSEFEKLGVQFDEYVKQFHDPWNYMYYTVYLAEKNEAEYTGQESYVWKMVQNKDPRFFPTLRAGNHIVPNGQDTGDLSHTHATVGGVGCLHRSGQGERFCSIGGCIVSRLVCVNQVTVMYADVVLPALFQRQRRTT